MFYSEGFRSLAENEEVFFEISENGGKSKAINVTGPGGAFVQGAPRRTRGEKTFIDWFLLSIVCSFFMTFTLTGAALLQQPDREVAEVPGRTRLPKVGRPLHLRRLPRLD